MRKNFEMATVFVGHVLLFRFLSCILYKVRGFGAQLAMARCCMSYALFHNCHGECGRRLLDRNWQIVLIFGATAKFARLLKL